ncbi:hypothetical protein A2380_01510 [candidate division WWE3 bacterium RIFOXYB1_FULL_43_24]|nr:MAG: hypothetical protein A2380_01510 [candidate division WWE3 bacterium RIFOXYB1_FULL_43_24]OGC72390.1 MAG: hypothetical protein A2414_02480 [candidate division WWE3 bacterium RIFOXYC1_FULL_42_13]
MTITQTAKTAFLSLQKNKVRSFLTMLGVIIGVFAVATLVSIVRGFQNYVKNEFDALGSNLIFIMPGKIDFTGDPSRNFTGNKLKYRHVERIQTDLGNKIESITPWYELSKKAVYKTKSFYAAVGGINESVLNLFNLKVDSGRFYTRAEIDAKARVAIIGSEVREELFNSRNPVNEKIQIDGSSYLILGVLEEKSPNYDNFIYIPYSTVESEFNMKNVGSIVIKVAKEQDVNVIKDEIRHSLLKELKDEDFSVSTQEDLLERINGILKIIESGLAAIAAISLLVGGIGIMNIMLVSVTERTREIGLIKALGATSRDIALQFLSESVFISVTGGFIGLMAALSATLVARTWIPAEIPMWAALVSLGFSFLVGIGFGTYPAIKAGKKDPIVALRYE